jgi:hypothetical protein
MQAEAGKYSNCNIVAVLEIDSTTTLSLESSSSSSSKIKP